MVVAIEHARSFMPGNLYQLVQLQLFGEPRSGFMPEVMEVKVCKQRIISEVLHDLDRFLMKRFAGRLLLGADSRQTAKSD